MDRRMFYDSLAQVPVENVAIGTTIVIREGDLIPIDGVIVVGSTTTDESTLTGESKPVPKKVGDRVSGGTIMQRGFIKVRTVALAKDSAIERIVRMMEEGQTNRSPTEKVTVVLCLCL